MKPWLAGGAIVAATLVGGGVANAQAYPPTVPPDVAVSIKVTTPGGLVEITLTGCTPGEVVKISFGQLRVERTCGDGVAAAALPAPATPGTAVAAAEGVDSGVTGSETVAVERPHAAHRPHAVVVASAGLPSTGTETNQTLMIAGAVLASGLGLAAVGYKRRHP